MIVTSPHWLWLLALVPLVAWAGWRRSTAGTRRWLVAALRGACIAAILLALARPLVRTHASQWTHVLVIDLGPTMPAQTPNDVWTRVRQDKAGDVRVIAFANRARQVIDPSVFADGQKLSDLRNSLNLPVAADDLASGGSAIAAALRLASAQISPDERGDVELISNGLATRGDAEAEAYRLAKRGIAVQVRPTVVAIEKRPPCIVRTVSMPAAASVGQTVTTDVVVESSVSAKATVTITAPGCVPVSRPIVLSPGLQTVHLWVPLNTPGLVRVSATVTVSGQLPSDAVATGVQVRAAARVLLVGDLAAKSTTEALTRLLGRSATIESISPDQLAYVRTNAYNAIVLADVPADALSTEAQLSIHEAVMDGTGLLLTGATRSFGPGGYETSALARLIPVRMPQQAESIDPSTTLVLIIDTSGSMEDFQRIDLAKEIAHLAVSHLKPHDKVGIVEFYGGKRWAVPIQSAANTAVINRALSRLTAGGGTTLFPAVEEAAFALGSVDTQSKNVMIISDGGVEIAPFAPLLRQMNEDGIAVSGIAVSPTPNQPNILPELSRWGGGRYYSVPDRFALPDISLKRPQISLLSPLVQSATELVGSDDVLIRATEVAKWPPVTGYVRTIAQPTADVLLRTVTGDPILARWRYGAGFVAALPTQLGSTMTGNLINKPAFAELASGLFRQIGSPRQNLLAIRPVQRAAGIEVQVEAFEQDPSVAGGTLQLNVTDSSGKVVRSEMAQPVHANHWNVLLPGLTSGLYELSAAIAGTEISDRAGIQVSGPRQVPRLTNDAELLKRIAGFGELAQAKRAGLPSAAERFLDLRSILVVTAIATFLVEVGARRWPGRGRMNHS